jgi:2-dehydro-3-deoxyglucarate aldolase/4-hydroxy-2-oxoheptanedioate aldolase
MRAAQLLKKKINNETPTIGILLTFHLWHGVIDSTQKAGLDYIVIDCEHGMHSNELVASVCAAGRLTDFPILLRVIDSNYSTIRRAIDTGPCGLLLPTVESSRQLDMVRDSIYMPPRGKRRPGGPGNYWVSDVNYPTWKREVEDDFIILPQIESKIGLEHVEEIASHEITTAVAVGPYDLSADLGVCFDPDHPCFKDAIAQIRAASEKAGKTLWNIGSGETLVEQGFSFICIGDPISIMEQSMFSIVENIKNCSS